MSYKITFTTDSWEIALDVMRLVHSRASTSDVIALDGVRVERAIKSDPVHDEPSTLLMGANLVDSVVYSTSCPECGASRGDWCRSSEDKGPLFTSVHWQRRVNYNQLHQVNQK